MVYPRQALRDRLGPDCGVYEMRTKARRNGA